MQILFTLAALPLLAAAPPTDFVSRAQACDTAADTIAARKRARPHKLGDLPSGRPWRAVYRLENGCPTPVAMDGPTRP